MNCKQTLIVATLALTEWQALPGSVKVTMPAAAH
jgi:hypothetical protein